MCALAYISRHVRFAIVIRWDICVSDGAVWLSWTVAFLLLFEQELSFIQIAVNLTFKPVWPPSTETTSGLKSIPSSGERNGSSKGGSNRWGSLILLDIYLGGALSTVKQNLSPIPPTLDCGLTLSCNSQIPEQVTAIWQLLYTEDASGQPKQIPILFKNTTKVLTLHSR